MPKVYGLHQVQLRPGVKPEDFEELVIGEIYPLPRPEGCDVFLLKGEKGDREGRYLFVMEFESLEARDRRLQSLEPEARAAYESFNAMVLRVYTDYVVVGK
jgi:hypothetical protein